MRTIIISAKSSTKKIEALRARGYKLVFELEGVSDVEFRKLIRTIEGK